MSRPQRSLSDMATTECASLDDLLGPDPVAELAGEYLTLPSGGVVMLRGLSRADTLAIGIATRDLTGLDKVAAIERVILARGMVSPAMTEDEAATWLNRPGAKDDVEAASDRIQELSSMTREAAKSAFKSNAGRSVDRVGSLSRRKARQDAGGDTGAV